MRSCPICKSNNNVEIKKYSTPLWKIVRCNDCKLIYLNNPPGYSSLKEDFAWEKTRVEEERFRVSNQPILHRADLATRWRHNIGRKSQSLLYSKWFKNGHLLNIGCAAAEVSYPGFTQFGIEISKGLASQANANLKDTGGYCINGPGSEAITKFDNNFFDGIIMRSYLEHEEYPLEVLLQARRIIKETGKIYVRVPNFNALGRKVFQKNWVRFRYPDHVNYFNVTTLSDIANRTNFKVHLLNPIRLPFDDNINALFEPI